MHCEVAWLTTHVLLLLHALLAGSMTMGQGTPHAPKFVITRHDASEQAVHGVYEPGAARKIKAQTLLFSLQLHHVRHGLQSAAAAHVVIYAWRISMLRRLGNR